MAICDTGTMTSTHTGNPVCIAAAIANIDYFKNNLVKHARLIQVKFLYNELEKIKCEFPERIGCIQGKGLVYGVHIVKKIPKTRW